MNPGDKVIVREPMTLDSVDGNSGDEFGRSLSAHEGLVRLWEDEVIPVEGKPVELWGVQCQGFVHPFTTEEEARVVYEGKTPVRLVAYIVKGEA